ncbi:alpha/beta hydrolase family protein [Paenibacillus lemnae]|uniref:S9 family peptidase n=1 Tax=Paenibacillus lemnae TaxID=1330551 RepID=A0A848MC33_PAELE|nr:prolyl oligopeptidase family serine peptidase [Paenibacillus lemnae]NMO97789.1 S9 family peptidase [Paenibacillus lemnae]
MIFKVTYLSDDLKVIGYLALPSRLTGIHAEYWLTQLKLESSVINAELIACYCDSPKSPADNLDPLPVELPLLVYCRGGIGRVGAVRMDWLQQFAGHGCIVFAPAYRGNEGSEGRDEFGGSDMQDVLNALHWLKRLEWINPERIHFLGFSRGTINAAYAAVHAEKAASLILWGGVSDLALTYEERVDLRRMMKRVIGGTPAKYPERYEKRSPVHYVPLLNCPVLIVHGSKDHQVSIQHAYLMYKRLQEHGKKADMHIYEDLGHHLPLQIHLECITRMFEWISKVTPQPHK